jgi:prefoldin subunit 5
MIQQFFSSISKDIGELKTSTTQNKSYDIELSSLRQEMEQHEKAISNIKLAFENGAYSLDDFISARKTRDDQINICKQKITTINTAIQHDNPISHDELLTRYTKFQQQWTKTTTPQERNVLIRQMIKRIYYYREPDDTIRFEIEY